ncbi:hypothetical protein Poli38472_005751 [Pythium oligandrum]|uniref:Uncharacterized protein n=1 Tax=Pythium oligandrum TaxID=41045 RepID=A0A8K1CST3_PYTOL|nr:hypothetical protein Poli38472_005751 [Pythium oligandrum]|eukprot:TMW68283.1 hypothetical protein Poli38472_005751 [Pythium oligandrum]
MLASGVDLREEMDENVARAALGQRSKADDKARFLIRTLPRECNPTPMTAQQTSSITVSGGAGAASVGVTSPRARKSMAEDELVVTENPFDDITEDKLRKLTGKQDLSRVTTLQLSVDSGTQSVEVIGELLPSLQQLRLLNCTLHSFRDLGTSLHSLQILWIAHCEISDLDGISALTGLQKLYVPHNHISDISPLTMHEELQVIDLEDNEIVEIGQVEQLAFCPQLTTLTLRDNPLCGIQHYRAVIATFVPQLQTLDNHVISDSERQKLSDAVIDAAILAFSEEQAMKATIQRPESSHGRPSTAERSPQKSLARSSSATRVVQGMEPASGGADAFRDDYGSTLTHGTDIVFAGNVTSALRRHRSESENDATAALAQQLNNNTLGQQSGAELTRPATPARESITATLDRAYELETNQYKSRDAILHELRAWQLETAGASQVGVVSLDDAPTTTVSPAVSPAKRPPTGRSSKSRGNTAEKRPNTSAGVLRNGMGVREAFVETSRDSATSDRRMVKRHSASGSSGGPPSARKVDILVLDDSPPQANEPEDDQRPCSPRKTARGVFTTSTLVRGDEWNLQELAPKLDLQSTESFLRRKSFRGNEDDDGNGLEEEHSSGESDEEDMRRVARQLKQRRPTSSTKQKTKGFFNVAESLHAIDRWREQMEEDVEPAIHAEPEPPVPDTTPPPASPPIEVGPACQATDEQIVQWMKAKHAIVAETKTREGFRRFFRGIKEERLQQLLQQVFGDGEKVRRRLQLMQGYFHQDLLLAAK